MKLLIVDDDSILSQALALSLKSFDFSVIDTANTATTALEKFNEVKPDICLIDIDLRLGPTGIDLAHVLRRVAPSVGIVFLTSLADPRLVDSTIPELPENSIYLVKSSISDLPELARMLRIAGSGTEINELGIQQESTFLDLTKSQFEVMRLVANGHSNAEIAKIRVTTLKSTENSIARLAKKLGIKKSSSASQRVLIARKYGELTGKL